MASARSTLKVSPRADFGSQPLVDAAPVLAEGRRRLEQAAESPELTPREAEVMRLAIGQIAQIERDQGPGAALDAMTSLPYAVITKARR